MVLTLPVAGPQTEVVTKLALTPIFSRDLARMSAPFFWLTNIMMGGSKPFSSMLNSFFL